MFGLKNPCAWCPQEEGETPQEGESHGICDEHAEQVILQHKQLQFDKVPSYVTQREQFEQYRERKSR